MSEQDIICLDVGGTKYKVRRSTLTQYPQTLLGAMFSTERTNMCKQESDGSYFFDRDGDHFRHVLNFYRTKTVYEPVDEQEMKALQIEYEFWGIGAILNEISSEKSLICRQYLEKICEKVFEPIKDPILTVRGSKCFDSPILRAMFCLMNEKCLFNNREFLVLYFEEKGVTAMFSGVTFFIATESFDLYQIDSNSTPIGVVFTENCLFSKQMTKETQSETIFQWMVSKNSENFHHFSADFNSTFVQTFETIQSNFCVKWFDGNISHDKHYFSDRPKLRFAANQTDLRILFNLKIYNSSNRFVIQSPYLKIEQQNNKFYLKLDSDQSTMSILRLIDVNEIDENGEYEDNYWRSMLEEENFFNDEKTLISRRKVVHVPTGTEAIEKGWWGMESEEKENETKNLQICSTQVNLSKFNQFFSFIEELFDKTETGLVYLDYDVLKRKWKFLFEFSKDYFIYEF